MRLLPDRRRAALLVGAGLLGVLAAWQGFAWNDTRSWVPDLLTGWTLAGLGLSALPRSRGAASLLLIAGVAWFVGDFHATGPHWLGWLATHLSWVFLAPLVQLALAYPSSRPRSVATLVVVGATWAATVAPWVNWNDDTTLAVAMGALTVAGIATARRTERGSVALLLLLVWALAVPQLTASIRSIGFDAGAALVGVWLFAGLRSGRLAERAIELDESTGTLREALAAVLRDPGLELGFPTSAGEFVDESGRPVSADAHDRTTTELEDVSGVVGIIVHDLRVLARDEDRSAVAVAVALAAARTRLREELRRRVDEVSHSTLKLINAEDDERRMLAARLDAATGRSLRVAARLLADGLAVTADEGDLAVSLDRARHQLERAQVELAALTGGLGVRAIAAGLSAAVIELVDGLPIEAEVRVAELECRAELATTIWFVCSEGVSNVLKHAAASRLLLEVGEDRSGIWVVVEDDGRGGADANGSGLAGLRDRVAALGGRLRVEPAEGGGTRLAATLPREFVAG